MFPVDFVLSHGEECCILAGPRGHWPRNWRPGRVCNSRRDVIGRSVSSIEKIMYSQGQSIMTFTRVPGHAQNGDQGGHDRDKHEHCQESDDNRVRKIV